MGDLLRIIDRGDVAVLALFDAAFDTIDHAILLCRLHESFGIDDGVLARFASYLQAGLNTCVMNRRLQNPRRCSMVSHKDMF